MLVDTMIKPSSVTVCESSGGGVDFTVKLITSDDWSLAGFYGEEGLKKKSDLARALFWVFYSMDAERVYAPTPIEFNGKVVKPEIFTTSMTLRGRASGTVEMLRNKEVPADGTILRNVGDAFAISASGCPTGVATYKQHQVVFHAGRDCLLDRVRVDSFDEQEGRPYGSVVTSVMETLKEESREFGGFDPRKVRAWVYGSIRPEDFTHPLNNAKYGTHNGKMYGYVQNRFGPGCVSIKNNDVHLDLPVLIQRQFMQLGVPGEGVNLKHAYLPEHFPTTRTNSQRYLVVAVRNSLIKAVS